MHFEFKDDVEEKIVEGLEESTRKVGNQVAKRWKFYTYNHLSGTEWGDQIKGDVSSIVSTYEYSEFYIDHPAAYIHEFGGTVTAMRQAEAEGMAFSWDSDQYSEAQESIMESGNGEVTIVPPKRFLRSAIEQTKKDFE